MHWRDRAACRGKNTDLWFPAPTDKRARDVAQAICARCPVTGECGAYAQREHIVDGIWGGKPRSIARDRTERGIRRSSKTLTAAERQQLVELGLLEPLSEAG